MTRPPGDWDAAYLASTRPPWDIGRPQPAFVQLAEAGQLSGRLLDAGCGTGEHTLLAAAKGADALGVDVSQPAIEQARRKAIERQVAARFEVGDALAFDQLGTSFDTVLDCGLFHVFDDQERARYVASLASVLAAGGCLHLMCFSEREPGDWGPRRVREDELTTAFSDGWAVLELVRDRFEVNPGMGDPTAHAWRAALRRL